MIPLSSHWLCTAKCDVATASIYRNILDNFILIKPSYNTVVTYTMAVHMILSIVYICTLCVWYISLDSHVIK